MPQPPLSLLRAGMGLPRIALLAACAALVLTVGSLAGCSSYGRKPPPAAPVIRGRVPELTELGLTVYPSARLAPGESAVAAPIPGGMAYLYRYRVNATGEKILDFYEQQLKSPSRPSGPSDMVAGLTRYGDRVTVLLDPRAIALKRGGKVTTIRYTEILITVRRTDYRSP